MITMIHTSNKQLMVVVLTGMLIGLYLMGVSLLSKQLSILLLLLLFCPFLVLIVGNVRWLLLGILILDIPFQLDTHFFYQEEVASLGALGGVNLSITTICLAALYVLWLIKLLTKVTSPPHQMFRMSLPLITYLFFVILSLIVARNVPFALFEITLLLQMFLLYFYIIGTVRSRQDILFIVTVLLVSVVLESLIMIGVRFIGESFQFAGVFVRIHRDMSVAGTVGSGNNAAGFLQLLLAPALSVLLTRLRMSNKCIATLAFILGGIALVLTLSRGGWISFIFSISIFCLIAWRYGLLSAYIPITIAIFAVLISLLLSDTIIMRLLGDDKGSAYSRIPLMKFTLQMILDNPLMGIGANNFAVMIKEYDSWEFAGDWLYVVHNKYFLVAAEIGIAGLSAFIWFLLATIRRGWYCWKLNDCFLSPIFLGFTLAIIGNMIHMLVDVFHSRPDVQLLWLIAGLITAMYNLARKEKSIVCEGVR